MSQLIKQSYKSEKCEKDRLHKTVVYFGDTGQREKNKKKLLENAPIASSVVDDGKSTEIFQQEKSVFQLKKHSEFSGLQYEGKIGDFGTNDTKDNNCLNNENVSAKNSLNFDCEIIINVSPTEEDVLKIKEDKSEIEEYWSLPGDNSGFRADWSFVQQWRLRGSSNRQNQELHSSFFSRRYKNSPSSRSYDSIADLEPISTDFYPHISQHRHSSCNELRKIHKGLEYTGNSSSEENRSSGHASMSDTGGHTSSSSPSHRHHESSRDLNSMPEDDRFSASVTQKFCKSKMAQNRTKHRANSKLPSSWSTSGLEEIKLAIQELTIRSNKSSSTYSSLSDSESSEPALRKLARHSSIETINTNITNADEFVWVDSHNRLVELQQLPWTHHDVLKVFQNGRVKDHMEAISMEIIPRLSYLLQRALVRIGREIQRLTRPIGFCSKQEVYSAFKIILSPELADSCIKACLRTAAIFAVSGDQIKQSKSSRSGLQLSVGRFFRWMCNYKLGRMIHEYAAIYLTAGIENLLEEILLQCFPIEPHAILTASLLEQFITNNSNLWGLLQPCAHLNAGRIASGVSTIPHWIKYNSLKSSSTSSTSSRNSFHTSILESSLLTTCVGSLPELVEFITRISQLGRFCLLLSTKALHTLFYYMRCSQLEHSDENSGELTYERTYIVLPPLIEWLRVAMAHVDYRHGSIIDHDDINQAARLLLPGVDCPIRLICFEEVSICSKHVSNRELIRLLNMEMAFKMLMSGETELITHALALLPVTKINTLNDNGFSALMLACISGNENVVAALIEAGADVNVESPPRNLNLIGNATSKCFSKAYQFFNGNTGYHAGFNAETQYWTALTYSALLNHCNIAKILLEKGAMVEGGAKLNEDKCTITPLQAAAAAGNNEMVTLLLSYGAQPFLSTIIRDSFSYSETVQRGSYSAISVAAVHGHKNCLRQLLQHPLNFSTLKSEKEILSLEEILAEGNAGINAYHENEMKMKKSLQENKNTVFSKIQMKALQEAMYHSVESNHLDITMELHSMKINWTLHCWMCSLATAHELKLDSIIYQLLKDIYQVFSDGYSSQFIQECLPLLFNVFKYSKIEETILLLGDIFCKCYGWEQIKAISDTVLSNRSKIDPKFVNNPELSDVQFLVEGKIFYGHKIVLITSSQRFRNMLSSKLCEGSPPIIQVNDIKYHIFQMIMEFLYHGGCTTLKVSQNDVMELMAAANFFQLDGLLQYCESLCSTMIDFNNIVSMYIHAEVYNATQLVEYCQGFILQNMVSLLTYDDSIRCLLFAKKLPNHDVLAGLLLTLQNRMKAKQSQENKSIQHC